jgi:hypothetical protein
MATYGVVARAKVNIYGMKKPDESNAKHHDKVNRPRASLN